MASRSVVRHLAEIVIWAHDVERHLAFYRDLLGLEDITPAGMPNRFLVAARTDDGVPEMIVLVPHPEPQAVFPSQKAQRTLHHLAFSVDPGAFDDLLGRLGRAGLEVRSGVHPVLKSVRTAYVDDPDGNEVELIAPLAEGAGGESPAPG
ncbi:MAG TPA: VOC family protein [Candidatus Nitrosotalea sp.]|nr:VOC family protein [Candidatus Nitrosotalea sp.]